MKSRAEIAESVADALRGFGIAARALPARASLEVPAGDVVDVVTIPSARAPVIGDDAPRGVACVSTTILVVVTSRAGATDKADAACDSLCVALAILEIDEAQTKEITAEYMDDAQTREGARLFRAVFSVVFHSFFSFDQNNTGEGDEADAALRASA